MVVWRPYKLFQVSRLQKSLKIGLSHLGKMYIACALFWNALTCHYRNTTADYFGLDPPPLIDYFSENTVTKTPVNA